MRSGRKACASSRPRTPSRGELDLVALQPQRALQDLGDLLVVLDDEHAHGAGGGIHRLDGTRGPAESRAFSVLLARTASVEQGSGGRASKGAAPDASLARRSRRPFQEAPRAPVARPHFALPELEQRQLDLIGLALVALGLFFAFLVYFGWDGGRAGRRPSRACAGCSAPCTTSCRSRCWPRARS